jgi:hypothetical protein
VDVTLPNLEADVAERLHTAEPEADAVDLKLQCAAFERAAAEAVAVAARHCRREYSGI